MALPRLLELYCGIGGCAVAVDGRASVTMALDVSTVALSVYHCNFVHRAEPCALESLRAADPRLAGADIWWLSPPCQPYTRRGLRRDLDDPRSRSFLHLIDLIAAIRPPALALENVPEMRGSRGHARLREVLDRAGYAVAERILCPTELGIPNRRRRFYLVGNRDGLTGWATAATAANTEATGSLQPLPRLAAFLDPEDDDTLRVAPPLLARYAYAADVVDAADPLAVAATFTSAYGRSPVRAGSYLHRHGTVRLFSPSEVLRLLGFPSGYRLPASLQRGNVYRLLGNSVSVPAVREVLSALPVLSRYPLTAPQ